MDIGNFSLIAAWLLSLYGAVAGFWAASKKRPALARSAVNGLHMSTLLTVASLVALAAAFVTHDYRYTYVWQHSNNQMHPMYLVSAIWGGMDGSMLLWAGIMAIFCSLVIVRKEGVQRDLMIWVAPILSASLNFFLLVVAFLTNPFRLVPTSVIPVDGTGLNPLLQNPSMLIHPPMLYCGFTGFVVPFAFCLAALFSGQLSDNWIRVTRRWTLVAWGFLTAGIILGGNWAYIELGWGGFWAWDPVENASFLPWLTGTAYLHSVMVQQRRGMLKVWNVCLSVLTYTLAIFGTFLTRSGVVQSVHAFAETDVGWVFLVYIAVLLAVTGVLLAYRWQELRPENKIESFLSREAAFLFNNLALLGICFATFWGVMFPVISEAVAGEKSVVGPPFFNQVNVPLFLILLFLMGIGPLIAWRKTSLKTISRLFLRPALIGSAVTLLCFFLDRERILAAVSFGLAVFALVTVFGEFHRALRARKLLAPKDAVTGVVALVRSKPQRYGGLVVHLGIALMAISITASMVYKIERDFVISVGEKYAVGNFVLRLDSLVERRLKSYTALQAKVAVFDQAESEQLGVLEPERRFYHRSEEPTTEVDIRMTPREDLYLALAGIDNGSIPKMGPVNLTTARATFKVFINPLQVWLWVGSVIVLFGTLALLWPTVRQEFAEHAPAKGSAEVSA